MDCPFSCCPLHTMCNGHLKYIFTNIVYCSTIEIISRISFMVIWSYLIVRTYGILLILHI